MAFIRAYINNLKKSLTLFISGVPLANKLLKLPAYCNIVL
nr:MAG TPA: Mitochondrial import receptor subunit-like protein [Caudoviricetes sp.]